MTIKMNHSISIIIIFLITTTLVWYVVQSKKNYTKHTAEQIYKQLDSYRITYDIDAHNVGVAPDTKPKPIQGIAECIRHITHLIHNNQPLKLLLVGFPFKSSNHEKKTLGKLPDMAERKSLEYLQELLNNIKKVYPSGADLTIFCDGTPYANFFGISLQDVVAYENALQRLAQDLPNITLHTSTDIMHKHQLKNLAGINTLIDAYPPSDELFKKTMYTTPLIAHKRFALELDHEAGKKILEQQSIDDITVKMLARETRMRNYISEYFPEDSYLRLTVHFSQNVSKKFGIKLSPNADITPYHGILVVEENSWTIRLKKDINLNDYQLMTQKINGIDCSYVQRTTY